MYQERENGEERKGEMEENKQEEELREDNENEGKRGQAERQLRTHAGVRGLFATLNESRRGSIGKPCSRTAYIIIIIKLFHI